MHRPGLLVFSLFVHHWCETLVPLLRIKGQRFTSLPHLFYRFNQDLNKQLSLVKYKPTHVKVSLHLLVLRVKVRVCVPGPNQRRVDRSGQFASRFWFSFMLQIIRWSKCQELAMAGKFSFYTTCLFRVLKRITFFPPSICANLIGSRPRPPRPVVERDYSALACLKKTHQYIEVPGS